MRKEGEVLSVKGEGRSGELGSDLDPDPLKILLIQIRPNDADLDQQHCLLGGYYPLG